MPRQQEGGHAPHQHHSVSTRRALAPLAALLLFLAVIALWGSAQAAPRDAGTIPTLEIVNLSQNRVTLDGQHWEANGPVLLSYSAFSSCQQRTSLDPPANSVTASSQGEIHLTYTWPPANRPSSPIYFCASGQSADHAPATIIHTPQTISVDAASGTVTFSPGSAPTPTATLTPTITATFTSTPANGATATIQAATATAQAATATAKAVAPGSTATARPQSTPGNKAAVSQSGASTAIAFSIILALCFLVLLLLIRLIRIWQQGRQTLHTP